MTAALLTNVLVLMLAYPLAHRVHPRARGGCHASGVRRRPRQSPLAHPFRPRRTAGASTPDVIELLDALASDVRSGTTLRAALEWAAGRSDSQPSRAAVAAILRSSAEGPPAGSPGSPALAIAAQAIGAALTLGGSQARTLDTAASLLRERHSIDLERHAQSSQARLSAKVMTVIPIVFTSWVLLTNDAARRAASSPLGATSLAAGACLNAAGWLWMRRIVQASR